MQPLPKPGETITVKLDVLPEYLAKYFMHIQEVTKDLVLVIEPKKDEDANGPSKD